MEIFRNVDKNLVFRGKARIALRTKKVFLPQNGAPQCGVKMAFLREYG